MVASSQHRQCMETHFCVLAPASYVDALIGSSPFDLDLGTNILLLCSPIWNSPNTNVMFQYNRSPK
jgi:hypothetical protein